MRTYKVVPLKKKSFLSSQLQPSQFEDLLNEHGRDGWVFDKPVAGDALFMDRDTALLVFYQDVPDALHETIGRTDARVRVSEETNK